MKSPLRGLNLGGSRGYLRMTPKDHQVQPIEIKVHGWNQYLKLRGTSPSTSLVENRGSEQ